MELICTASISPVNLDSYRYNVARYFYYSVGRSRKIAAEVSELTGEQYTSLKVYDFALVPKIGNISMCQW